jgi:protein phosphatase 1 regulatory subunit 10
VKKEVKPLVTAVKDAKSDSSFFSAPKPKPKLPNFKKAPAPPAALVKTEPDPHVAQPSAIDPFQEALKSMGKARRPSPATVVPSIAANIINAITVPVAVQSSKKKKSVSWAPEGKLELIRLIERAIYDDDPVDVSYFPSQLLRFVVLYINSVLCLLVTGSTYSAQLTRSGPG